MPWRRPRLPAITASLIALGLLASLTIAPATAASVYTKDVYFEAGYERQVDSRTCTAASTAMILNFVARRDLKLDQLAILRYAQPRDALVDSQQRGTDPLGWSKALTYYSPKAGKGTIKYRWEAYTSEYAALKRAAKQLASMGRASGLLVQNGKHAMVMTGFEASRNPLEGEFQLLAVWVSDPLGSKHRRYIPSESPLNKYLELDATSEYDKAWYGKYVIVAPYT